MIPKLIEITTRIGCSLNCRFCPQELLTKSYYDLKYRLNNNDRSGIMSFDTFKSCIDKIPVDIDIHFSGMCESWLNPECTKMLLYAYEKGHRIHIYTTLVGMKHEDYIQIKKINVDTFVLHIPDAEGNSKIPMDKTYMELFSEVIYDTINGLFKINSFSCHGAVHMRMRELIESTGIRINNQMYDRAGNIKEECDIQSKGLKKGNIICKWCGGSALDKNVLLPDGTVLMCRMDYGMKFPLGNLLYQSYNEVSEGKEKKYYRKLLSSDKYGDILCRTCHRSIVVESDKWEDQQ